MHYAKFFSLAALAFASAANAAVIDFEAIPEFGVVDNQYPGVFFSSPGSFVEVGSYGTPWGTSPPNIACPRNFSSYCGGDLEVLFSSSVSGLQFYFTGDNFAGIVGGASIFDSGNTLLASTVLVGDGDISTAHLVDFSSFASVERLVVTISFDEFNLSGLGFDDFSFNAAQAVSAPSSTSMIALGLGLFACSWRRMRA